MYTDNKRGRVKVWPAITGANASEELKIAKFALMLNCDFDNAKRLYAKYGRGYIYIPGCDASDITAAYVYSERLAERLVYIRKYVVIIDNNGKMRKLTTRDMSIKIIGQKIAEAKRADAEMYRERAQIFKDRRAQIESERAFREGQEKRPSPKHEGRAKSFASIGKYK